MIRLIAAIFLAKAIIFLTRTLKIGGGSAAPGYYALKICPELISKISANIPQNVVITGTNGKTTTSRILNHLVKSQKIKTLRNSTGSNLERGVASALLGSCDLMGNFRGIDLGIWELDEAAFNKVVFRIKPKIIVFLNAFRDQLDRYGEVDTVVKRWFDTLSKVDWSPKIIVNNGDLNTASLNAVSNEDKKSGLEVLGFKVKNHVLWKESEIKLNEKTNFSGDEILAEIVKNEGLNGTLIKVFDHGFTFNLKLPIAGIYHIYDFLAAYGIYSLLNLPRDEVQNSIKGFNPAFGRVEKLEILGRQVYIFLIKNPAGTNAVLETLIPEIGRSDRLLLALNDNFADGMDVSWIWDADFETLFGNKPIRQEIRTDFKYPKRNNKKSAKVDIKATSGEIVVSGKRCFDLALRLKYAGADTNNLQILEDLKQALEMSVTDLNGRLFILPTYTALLSLQKIFADKKIKSHYWRSDE